MQYWIDSMNVSFFCFFFMLPKLAVIWITTLQMFHCVCVTIIFQNADAKVPLLMKYPKWLCMTHWLRLKDHLSVLCCFSICIFYCTMVLTWKGLLILKNMCSIPCSVGMSGTGAEFVISLCDVNQSEIDFELSRCMVVWFNCNNKCINGDWWRVLEWWGADVSNTQTPCIDQLSGHQHLMLLTVFQFVYIGKSSFPRFYTFSKYADILHCFQSCNTVFLQLFFGQVGGRDARLPDIVNNERGQTNKIVSKKRKKTQ